MNENHSSTGLIEQLSSHGRVRSPIAHRGVLLLLLLLIGHVGAVGPNTEAGLIEIE